MTDLPLLTLILAIPAIGALILVAFLRGEDEAAALNAKRLGLLVTTFTFVLSLPLMTDFDPNDTGFQFVEEGVWFGGLSYKLGIDGISMP
ncbi:MAG: NADH-quinone oxidoreductase subunit M, partial [Pseudomonadota bacterium]